METNAELDICQIKISICGMNMLELFQTFVSNYIWIEFNGNIFFNMHSLERLFYSFGFTDSLLVCVCASSLIRGC